MISSKVSEYSPFLNWNRNDPVTVDSVALVFSSLASMLKDNSPIDETLGLHTSQFVRSISWNIPLLFTSRQLMMALSKLFADPISVFVDSIVLLLSLPFPSVVDAAILIVQRCFKESRSTMMKLHPSLWGYRTMTNKGLQNLLTINKNGLLHAILEILLAGLRFTSVDSIPDVPPGYMMTPEWIGKRMLPESISERFNKRLCVQCDQAVDAVDS
ncbi:hypothetical protein BLNAU_18468 [Blattamonas nauphoetae]|uniref:Uncharacterized protein n=1 Tax=Blattamonas nauphoetae TaxID=2049346 RepID=A0ABQ9X6V1_9EUKA|nr:hypothetical protein BLNAU_18468 [Blattamonas nauphoetae]